MFLEPFQHSKWTTHRTNLPVVIVDSDPMNLALMLVALILAGKWASCNSTLAVDVGTPIGSGLEMLPVLVPEEIRLPGETPVARPEKAVVPAMAFFVERIHVHSFPHPASGQYGFKKKTYPASAGVDADPTPGCAACMEAIASSMNSKGVAPACGTRLIG